MAKTIEELSDEYVKSTLAGSEYVKKNAFKAGANAVLEEIEKVFDPSDEGLLYNAIKYRIKELKG